MKTYKITFNTGNSIQLMFPDSVSLEDINTQLSTEIVTGFYGPVDSCVIQSIEEIGEAV